MKSRAPRLVCLAVLAALTSCGQTHDVTELGPQPKAAGEPARVGATNATSTGPRSALCDRLAQLQCDAEAHCCEQPGRTLPDCKTARRDDCAQNVQLDAVAADPVAGYDANAAEGIFGELQRRLTACDPEVVRWSAGAEGLRGLFKGSVEPGQSCKPSQLLNASMSQQAAALLSCRDAVQHACMPASLLGEWTCTPKSANGGSCLTDDNCAADSYCATPAQAVFGSCGPRLAQGEACSSATQCQSFACISGSCQAPDVQHAFCPEQG